MNAISTSTTGWKALRGREGWPVHRQSGRGLFTGMLMEKDPQFGKGVRRVTPRRRTDSWLF